MKNMAVWETAAEALADHPLQAGDVVLTGTDDAVSRIIARITGSSVSHSTLMLGPDHGIEAHDRIERLADHASSVADDIPGIHRVSLDHLATKDRLSRVVVRRPMVDVDPELLVRSAGQYLSRKTPFGGLGLALAGIVTWFDRWMAGLQPGSRVRDRLTDIVEPLVDHMQDGNETVFCSELAYRCLAEAGLRITLQNPHFATIIEAFDIDHAEYDDEVPVLTSDPVALLIDEREPGVKSIFVLFASAYQGWNRRRIVAGDGDIADFVVPSDFLTAEPFETVLDVELRSGLGWCHVG